jgi:hypothetical protein
MKEGKYECISFGLGFGYIVEMNTYSTVDDELIAVEPCG